MTTKALPTNRPTYRRDRYTFLAYFMLAYFAYTQVVMGPAMPFLRAELGLNYTIAGLHFSAFSSGMIIAGLTGAAVAGRLGRQRVFWGGGAGMAVGAALFVIGRTPVVTIGGALVMGVFGTYLMNIISSTLSDHHGANRATALTEANVVASGVNILPPLLVGTLAGTLVGWRATMWLAVIAWGLVLLTQTRVAIPAPVLEQATDGQGGTTRRLPLPRRFWIIWALIVFVVAVEWGITAWGADFMITRVGLDRALASGLISAYFLAMVTGRFVGSRLTRRAEALTLLPGALVLAFIGFLIFWLSPLAPLNVVGLFVAGLGIANLYPLSLAAGTTAAGDDTDRAGAYISLAAGMGALLAPQVLGAVADVTGIAVALGGIVVLLAGAGVLLVMARRTR